MMIIGCDFHPSWQQVAWVDTETGETGEEKLVHERGEAARFYQRLPGPALIGMESTGNCEWFLEMATAAGHNVWVGDAAKIRASDVRQQKHDRRDAALLLQLLLEGRFPRIWTPSSQEKDLRQLLIHRSRLVGLRARVKNELQHLALNRGVQKKRKLWSEAGQKVLREIPLRPWAGRRREDLLKLLVMLNEQVAQLDEAVRKAAEENENARLLMTQPGEGNRFLRMLLVEAAQIAVRCDPQMRNEYLHRCRTKPKGVAKVAAARKLAIRLYWMLRTQKPYPEIVRIESSSRVPLVSAR